jgi:hypothetical protein
VTETTTSGEGSTGGGQTTTVPIRRALAIAIAPPVGAGPPARSTHSRSGSPRRSR